MKHKVAELEGALLDAAVAMAEGYELDSDGDNRTIRESGGAPSAWHPSTDWHHGGPIIERELIEVSPIERGRWMATGYMSICIGSMHEHIRGTANAPLIAAMRAYVSSRFGEEVELP